MIKKILFSVLLMCFFIVNIFAQDTDYLEYADIPNTDVINFNWQVDWVTYRVWVNTWVIDYITWSDWKIHTCFPIVGTWYTNKLWEIYFQYNWYGSYICSDYKLRWVFKVWAWWWWYLEDLENNPEFWKLFLDKYKIDWYYYHWDWQNWTWQSWLDDIGFANWNNVKTKFNLSEAFSNITVNIQFDPSNLIADWNTKSEIKFQFLYNGNPLKNFSFSSISFLSGFNSDVEKNSNIIPWFEYIWWLITDENWYITWNVISYHPWKNLEYWIKIMIDDVEIIKTWVVYNFIKPPFDVNLTIQPSEITSKKLIWYKNTAKLTITSSAYNISNLNTTSFSSTIDLWEYSDYFSIIFWENIGLNVNEPIKLTYNPSKFYSWDSLPIRYLYLLDYSFTKNWDNYKILDFSWYTNYDYLYKDWKIDNIQIVPINTSAYADWKQVFWYNVKFLNSQDYPINNLTFSLDFSDPEKKFNLSSWWNYITGFFLVSQNTDADIDWTYKIWIISYKPVSKNLDPYLTGYIKNIIYNWYYSVNNWDSYQVLKNFEFLNIVNLNLDEKIIHINEEITLTWVYTSNSSNVLSGWFSLTWYIINCPSCWFEKWKILSGDDFWTYQYDIYLTGWSDPQALIYSGYIYYNLSWNHWIKKVWLPFKKEYKEFLFVGWWVLKLFWNVITNTKILESINYISTSIPISKFKNNLRKEVYNNAIKWNSYIILASDTDIHLNSLTWYQYIYKCEGENRVISLYWVYSKLRRLIFIDCQLNISNDILSYWNSHLSIFLFSSNWNNLPDFSSDNWWIIPGNIYISPSVKTIEANLFTDWSIFTYNSWNFSLDGNKIFFSTRWVDLNLRKQLFIYWKIFSKNTIWWGLQNSNNVYILVWWKKVAANWQWPYWKPASEIAQAYDLKFWRNNFVKSDWTYLTWKLSPIIYNKYNCTWNSNIDNPICSASVIIMDKNKWF